MHLKPLAAGLALAKTLVVLYVLCALVEAIVPGAQFSHRWLELFSAAPMGSARMWVEGIVASLVSGLVAGYLFAWSYNWTSKKIS